MTQRGRKRIRNMDPEFIEFTLKFKGESVPIIISENRRVRDMKSVVQLRTDVQVRNQKLIFKGRVLQDDDVTLKESEITNGCKITLLESSQRVGSSNMDENLVPPDESIEFTVKFKGEYHHLGGSESMRSEICCSKEEFSRMMISR
ncbi:hypothetical protein Scep_005738 [Stephania cephalantha]|uniref:Ubiquitin-like domain-containing protein n=1 Tax=Stephania cephalantha TaxID=152367 RepID=A0AAP0KY06_9MAGN